MARRVEAETIEDNVNTKQKILRAAMHLYAQNGINAVTLHQISIEAGCANTAAVHYHFGNRSGLLLTIVSFLGDIIWTPGYKMLQKTVGDGASPYLQSSMPLLTAAPQHSSPAFQDFPMPYGHATISPWDAAIDSNPDMMQLDLDSFNLESSWR